MAFIKKLTQLFARPADNPAVASLYKAAVAQARLPAFYRAIEVPDTVDGRFDLLVLHVFLIMRRLGDDMATKQGLFDLMFGDMDQNLREMGVGDMGMGRRMKAMIGAFYGRAQAYENALTVGGDSLDQALARNVYGKASPTPQSINDLADYVRRAVAGMEEQVLEDLRAGRVIFPAP